MKSTPAQHWKDDLSPLFAPASIAIVGASERNHYAEIAYKNQQRFPLANGRLYLVNPNRESVFGQPAFRSIAEVPDDVELAMILVNRSLTLNAVDECLHK